MELEVALWGDEYFKSILLYGKQEKIYTSLAGVRQAAQQSFLTLINHFYQSKSRDKAGGAQPQAPWAFQPSCVPWQREEGQVLRAFPSQVPGLFSLTPHFSGSSASVLLPFCSSCWHRTSLAVGTSSDKRNTPLLTGTSSYSIMRPSPARARLNLRYINTDFEQKLCSLVSAIFASSGCVRMRLFWSTTVFAIIPDHMLMY